MESLKKVISLAQAAKISGYHQDYLGYLIRKGELKGRKVGRAWFTTEEELKNYMFKQKVRRKRSTIWDFLSRKRTQKVVVFVGLVITLASVFFVVHWQDAKKQIDVTITHKALTADAEVMTEKMP